MQSQLQLAHREIVALESLFMSRRTMWEFVMWMVELRDELCRAQDDIAHLRRSSRGKAMVTSSEAEAWQLVVVLQPSEPSRSSTHHALSRGMATDPTVNPRQAITAIPLSSRPPHSEMHHASGEGAAIDPEAVSR